MLIISLLLGEMKGIKNSRRIDIRIRIEISICRQEHQEAVQDGRGDRHCARQGKSTSVQLRVVESEPDNLGHVPKTRTRPRVEHTRCTRYTVAVHVLE